MPTPFVKIVEVGPRDGLQNEPFPVAVQTKVELINRLSATGLKSIESGSFVSPKWIPQMAGTSEVLRLIDHKHGTSYPVLVPNMKGLEGLEVLLRENPRQPVSEEIAIFTAASETFNKRNINCTIAESLDRFVPVVERAIELGLRVRGYVSTAVVCPYEGYIEPEKVRDVTIKLLEMGCYEVSLGDTIGAATPRTMERLLDVVMAAVPIEMLAAHNHDTYAMAIANVLTALKMGIRTVDSSVAGLGGCPFAPGATGNVATEDLVYALREEGYETGVDLNKLSTTGQWISSILGRDNGSRVGKAWLARKKLQ
ncbi:3-hydroxy-3-methylglutaryl-CoA lyase [Dacryopinax primogenitus]|uniref:hydroxymethylglutaryl-CoA lyase n=1 Tax=Dacryopinax primogenitus (strain DJM 731) TaxID=1858805 RepID=M5FV15_DACPD|nr:3-hydroxy-3-methylglutaryl-CoA lyase [Dacryopinax primogenitus]EJU01611.1 3-hydroxy-3-methylglutaryl-CoA lyase [Dacryopinax primogenitus]